MGLRPTPAGTGVVAVVASASEQREWLRDLLGNAGYAVVPFGETGQALAAMAASPPDLVVAGLSREHLEGWALCRSLRSSPHEVLHRVPVLVVSADIQGQEAAQITANVGANGLLHASRGRECLLAKVEDLLARAAQAPPPAGSPEFPAGLERIREAVRDVEAGYFLLDAEGRFLWVNDAWLKLHGYSRLEEVAGRQFSLTQEEGAQGTAAVLVSQVLAGIPVPSGEFHCLRQDGSVAHHTSSMHPVLDDGRVIGVEGFVIDTTALHSAEQRYQMLFERLLDGFALHEMIFDADGRPADYRFLAVNPAFERITGLRADAVLGKTALEVLPGLERHWIEDYGRVVVTGEPFQFESRQASLGMDFEVVAYRPQPGRFACIFRDVTRQKESEKARKEIEERFAAIFEHFPAAAAISTLEDGTLLQVNQQYESVFGFRREELIGRSAVQLGILPQQQRAQLRDLLKRQGRFAGVELQMRGKAGRVLDCLVNIELIRLGGQDCLLSMVLDITERKRAEERWRTVLDTAMDGFWVVDSGGRFTEVNESACRMIGYDREEVLRMSVSDLEAAESVEEVAEHIRRTLAAGSDRFETRHRRKDGTVIDVQISATHLPSYGLFFAFLRDITERRRHEDERETMLRLLRLLNSANDLHELIREVPVLLREWSGCDAVGVRLKEGDDFPYFETRGFSPEFVEAENWLCERDRNGQLLRDSQGNPVLECMCGNVLCGRFDPRKPFFTEQGSFWTNSTSRLLASTTEADRQNRTRNRCNGEGYESVALIPLRAGGRTLGLLQCNDRREGRFGAGKIAMLERVAASLSIALEQRHTLQALRESEARYRSLFDQSGDGALLLQLGAGVPVILDANAAALKEHGYSLEEMVGQPISLLEPGISPEVVGERVRLLAERKPMYMVHRRKDGSTFDVESVSRWVRIGGQDVVLAVERNITERKVAEETLRASEERFRRVFQCSASGMVLVSPESCFLQVNDAFCRMLGYTESELLGRSFQDVTLPEDRPVGGELVSRTLSGEMDMVHFEKRYLRKDGSMVWGLVSSMLIRDAENKALHFITQVQDLTDRKRNEEERERLQAELSQAQKMESIGRLAGGIAHDFNNLLTVINGYSQLAVAQMSAGDPLRAQLSEIHKAGERAAGLTRQLLAFSRKQVLKPRALDLNRVLKGMRSMLERLMGEDVEVRFALSPERATVNADPHQLEQVIMNLAVNARDAMPRGGRLLIETTLVERDESYSRPHPEARAGRYAVLAVSDTGAGMDEATRQRIFEPFFTTKGVGQGTGLGLSMVQGIVSQSGGYIDVSSEPGRGTTFKIHLPALADVAGEIEQRTTASVVGGKETVLIVEDQEEVRHFVAAVLQAYGYRVIPAAGAAEALMICGQDPAPIHMVLTDVVMPHTSGQDLAARLERIRPGIKVLFMSGYTDNVILQHGVSEGESHFIQKPFSPEGLAGKVRAVLGSPAPAA